MKKIRKIIIILVSVLLLAALIVFLLISFKDENKLTVEERNWINDSTGSVLNVNIVNDAYIFGNNGTGVFFDFLNDFSKEYELTINPITFVGEENQTPISFSRKSNKTDNDIVFYEDHYVLVGKSIKTINSINDLNGLEIGTTNEGLEIINQSLDANFVLHNYENKEAVLNALANDDIGYIIIPLDYYLGDVLTNNYEILYHFSDLKYYYSLVLDDSIFSRVLKKYFAKWENFKKYYNEEEFALFKESLDISDSDVESIRREVLSYGFVNTSPYEVIKGGNFGGINAVTLKKFSDFSEAEFNFVKYGNFDKFIKAINNNEVDLYFNRYSIDNSWASTNNVMNINYDIIANRKNNLTVSSLKSLQHKTVYVEEFSMLQKYLLTIRGINIETYSSEKELLKLNKKDVIILIDSNIYDYYANTKLDNYTSRYSGALNSTYNFKINNNVTLNKLLNKYISTLDKKVIITEGLQNHYNTVKTGIILGTIAKYLIYLVVLGVIVLLLVIRKTKKVYIARRIKRDEKLKFIDQLTSLKNRNYLNECISTWNNNIIYPQAVIVVDLNNLQEINDLNGYSEGDKQIQACANILIRTQLDNSEIMRTDGNEFVIYLVGYSQKQVSNYIHKLNREMDNLPYKNGAEFGYSMIDSNLKSFEDALNESVETMKNAKKVKEDENKN